MEVCIGVPTRFCMTGANLDKVRQTDDGAVKTRVLEFAKGRNTSRFEDGFAERLEVNGVGNERLVCGEGRKNG